MVEKIRILEKATKLYNLTKSSNEHESKLASEKFNAFLQKNNLTLQEVIDNDVIEFYFEQENKYELFLFNHLVMCQIEKSLDLMKRCTCRLVNERKVLFRLTKYVKDSMMMKYQRLLQVYQEDREVIENKIKSDNLRRDIKYRDDMSPFEFFESMRIAFETFDEPEVKFTEEHFFISFIYKYDLVPKGPEKTVEQEEPKNKLSDQDIENIKMMQRMYSKKNVDNIRLENGNKIPAYFA